MHIPLQGVEPVPFAAPCPVFWLRDWEGAPVERMDRLHKGTWIAMVDDPQGWIAVVSRGLSCADVRLTICRGVLARTRRMPSERTIHHQVHTRYWHRDRLAWWAAEAAKGEGAPAVLLWWPVWEAEPRAVEELWYPDLGAEGSVAAKVQHAIDSRGPWAGPFDAHWAMPPIADDWGHTYAIDQIGRGDGKPLPGARQRCAGKGRTAEEAVRSAVCEAVERRCITQPDYSPLAVHRGTGEALRARWRVVRPADLVPFSEAQWASKPDPDLHAFFRLPERRMDGDGMGIELDWVEGTDWHSGEPVLVPRDFVFYRLQQPPPWFAPDTNGAAAGADWHDAARRGLREVLERAAVACWWIWRCRRPEIPIAALADDEDGRWCKRGPAALAKVGRTVHLLDLTLDERLPVVVAVSMQKDGKPDPVYGMGCARTTAEAARRALGEIVQCGMLDRPVEERLAYHRNAPEVAALAKAPRWKLKWMLPEGKVDPRDTDHGDGTEEAVAADLFGDAVVVDLTQRADEPAVVKVICPDAPHFWHRLGAPKLYTMPVEYGWLPKRPHERQANPILIGV